MIFFGWFMVGLGIFGTVGAVIMEALAREPIYLLVMKITEGLMGCGGILLAIRAFRPRG